MHINTDALTGALTIAGIIMAKALELLVKVGRWLTD